MAEAEWKAMWELFDRPPRQGRLPIAKVRHCVRGLGRQYLNSELDALLGNGESITYDEYVEALRKPYTEPECTLVSAFRAFDGKESGTITDQQLTKALTDGAEPMNDDEVQAATQDIDMPKGSIAIDDLVAALEERNLHPDLEELLKLAR